MGNGYCIAGQQPVFPGRRYLSPEEQEAEDVSDAIGELIEEDLDAGTEALIPLYDTCGSTDDKPLAGLLPALDADNLDDWLRLLLRCPVADAAVTVLNFRTWAEGVFRAEADRMGWTKRAEQQVQQGYADDARDAADTAAELRKHAMESGL